MPDQHAVPSPRRSVLPTLVVSVFFGAAAGVVGTLVIFAYVAPTIALHGTPYAVQGGAARRIADEAPATAVELAGRAAVTLALAKGGAGTPDAGYVPGDAIGAGFVLTSDGWLITFGDGAFAKAKRVTDLVAVIGSRAYPVRRMVRDSYSDAAFLKVDAVNLPVIAFGSAEAVGTGNVLFAPDAAGGLRRLSVLAYDVAPAKTVDDLLRSSERLERVILTSDASLLPGTMVLDAKGEVIGIAGIDGQFGQIVVPVEAFTGVIGPVLRDKQPARSMLGVHFVDLSQVSSQGPEGLTRGARVAASADGKTPAVLKKSPAEAAGLKAGDVIVAVDGAPVSAKNPLPDALADYSPGDVVTLTVVKAGSAVETSRDVTLGTAPTP